MAGAAVPLPCWGSQDQGGNEGLGAPDSGPRVPARIPQDTESHGRALWGHHTLAQARGKGRSPGHVPAALFEVTPQSDAWKSWRASKLQPCCPARSPTAYSHYTAPNFSLYPLQDPIFLSFLCCWILGSSSRSRNSPSACVSVGLKVDRSLCRKHPCGIPTGELHLQHRGYLGWRYGRDRSRQ